MNVESVRVSIISNFKLGNGGEQGQDVDGWWHVECGEC